MLINIKNKLSSLGLFFCLVSTPLFANDNEEWFSEIDNLRIAIDLSVRGQYNINSDHLSNIDSLGIDLHKVFTTSNGSDFATLIFQGYLNQLVNAEKYPAIFHSKNDLKFICRICNVNFSILDRGNLNFRIGHYELPFGLEFNQDTNGTLRQYSNGRDLGGKLDWGLTANGQFLWGGYELSLSRGTGVDWTSDYKSYIVSGRIEKTFAYSSFFAFSAFHGHINKANSSAYIDRTRVGIDAQTEIGPFTLLTELSGGKDDSTHLLNSLIEIDIQNNTENLLSYLQFKTTSHQFAHQSWDSIIQTSFGIRYTPDRFWVISSQWTHDIKAYQSVKKNSQIELQLRYRF